MTNCKEKYLEKKQKEHIHYVTTNLYKRGTVWYVKDEVISAIGDEIWSNRPALIVSNDMANQSSNVVQIVYLTSKEPKRKLLTHIKVNFGHGQFHSVAKCEQIHTVDKSRLLPYYGYNNLIVNKEDMDAINHALLISMGLTDYSMKNYNKRRDYNE